MKPGRPKERRKAGYDRRRAQMSHGTLRSDVLRQFSVAQLLAELARRERQALRNGAKDAQRERAEELELHKFEVGLDDLYCLHF